MKVLNNLDDLIMLLQCINNKYKTEGVQVSVNLISDRVLALQSICLDNSDPELGVQLFLEADMREQAEFKPVINFYEQGEKLFDFESEDFKNTLDNLKQCGIIKT